MKQMISGGLVAIELTTLGESFEFMGQPVTVIPFPETLRATAQTAREAGHVPRMVRLETGVELLMVFPEGALVRWFGLVMTHE